LTATSIGAASPVASAARAWQGGSTVSNDSVASVESEVVAVAQRLAVPGEYVILIFYVSKSKQKKLGRSSRAQTRRDQLHRGPIKNLPDCHQRQAERVFLIPMTKTVAGS
jgi:hypothetical protein